ncbi:Gag-like protein [Operophtera brumata]|uniref:Gag-like protein n=1 Tax=Operophtera brumata TaxID=104452 RepID=A0A0L7KVM1_OPEBR|nr:Gag-like protein [Operophtera brumata]
MLEARAAIPASQPPERSSHGRAGTPGAAAGRGKLTVPRGAVGETPEPQSGPSSTPAVMEMTQSLPSVILTGKKRARDITGRDTVATGKKPAAANTKERRPPLAKAQPGASWVEVTKRGKKGRPAVTSAPSQGTQSQARAKRRRKPAKGGKDNVGQPRLRAPTSSAIVLTIQSKGAEGGLTYVKALTEARQKVDLASLGITSALGFRQAVTGARMLEVPGEDSGPKADALAAKLRELFDEDILRVTRPVKCAELRVAGLDDSVTETDVVEAIARVGACSPNEVKVAGIRRNSVGLGAAFVRCPVSAAKKVFPTHCHYEEELGSIGRGPPGPSLPGPRMNANACP